jgi:acetylornithine/succinyldiaminopimelate/putrescine aminotransferase
MTREESPNLFRLYLNPHVVQACFCLERYAQSLSNSSEPFQSFLANSFDEALSGAIKLARYHASVTGKPTNGVIIDSERRIGPFAAVEVEGGRVEFVPGLTVIKDASVLSDQAFGFVVLMARDENAQTVRRLIQANSALLVLCVDQTTLTQIRRGSESDKLQPDIVVFDESFVDRAVPFGAFTARRVIYDHWNTGSQATFHSTTFQPNTISALHFLRCLRHSDPEFHASVAADLARIERDLVFRKDLFRRLYSPSLAGAIAMTGCDNAEVRVRGHYVSIGERTVFDAVGGVACSVRGHNPPTYAAELTAVNADDAKRELASRLRTLTQLDEMAPAVSGAGAVENALKLALVAQFPRRHVLALKAGFGGKTLLALTGTWKDSYKEHIDPLYRDVSYVDPFAEDAIEQIDATFAKHDVAVVQIELIQGVGGVRRIPDEVIRHLDAGRAIRGYLLLVDEVQTGMFRTGPFTLSSAMGVTPDLLVIGKAISDMMFPFALALFSAQVAKRLATVAPDLTDQLRRRYDYPFGFMTALNVLRFAEKVRLTEQVNASGSLFAKLLQEELAGIPAVCDVRVFGLLIGIELDRSRWPKRWFRKRLFWFYLAALLRHPRFPILVGFCQAEPNVLKITPPLTISTDEIRQMCAVIGEVLRRPFYRLLASAVGDYLGLFRAKGKNRDNPLVAADAAVHR